MLAAFPGLTPDVAFAAVLALAGIALAILGARVSAAGGYARLAAALYFAVAAGECLPAFANAATLSQGVEAIMLIAMALAPAALALAVFAMAAKRAPAPAPAAAALVLAFLCGLAAALSELVWLAVAPLVLSAGAIVLFALRVRGSITAAYAILSAMALIASAASWLAGSARGAMLFAAAALLGISLVSVRRSDARLEEKRARKSRGPAVNRLR